LRGGLYGAAAASLSCCGIVTSKAMNEKEEPQIARDDSPPAAPENAADVAGAPAESEAAADGDAVAELKDRYLRLAAEFDNFRKRTARERADLWGRAQADVVERLVDAIDDLARFAQVDPATTDPKTMHDGVDLVERKFRKALEGLGVQRVDAAGGPFDPTEHEAVSTQPAPAPDRDRTVGAVLEAGSQLGDRLIRPARVVVQTWDGDAGAASDGPATPDG
jgi:molecular chaperone GrpE